MVAMDNICYFQTSKWNEFEFVQSCKNVGWTVFPTVNNCLMIGGLRSPCLNSCVDRDGVDRVDSCLRSFDGILVSFVFRVFLFGTQHLFSVSQQCKKINFI